MTNDEANYLIERLKVLCADMTELLNQATEELGRIEQADTLQTDYPTEWCESCELWQDNNCKGVAECKRNIAMLKELNKLYEEADTPQTESTGSPIGDYRDGAGAWQTDCPWK